ncbi:M23 family metallopeptidase [Roseibium sp. Sym1]|uniref:M23 family metallopeptidase n=1 Tax=Roseibium sp. Sym1 TaxID=3016006 RepID=UPI0022B31F59|nr:M23 family metallopeptidase [Roseibium sp. Sym1]
MAQWPDNRTPGPNRPEFDRTVIRRPAAKPAQPGGGSAGPVPPASSRPEPRKPSQRRSGIVKYTALAIGFLLIGGAAGGLAHLISSGAISFSTPKETAEITETELAPRQEGPDEPEQPQEIEKELVNDEDLDIPADPFFDMALSAVIPLAGDPVLLAGGAASRRIDLSERPVPASASGQGKAAIPTASAFILDSRMLDDDGNLVIRAPGNEADFQFGNFGGGEDSDGLSVEDDSGEAVDTGPDLPVFLKPATNTLNLYLSERPIGQGPNRIEIREIIEKTVPLKEFLLENGFDEDAVKPLLDYAREEFKKSDMVAGDKISLRGERMPNRLGRVGDYYRPVQVSIHSSDGYVGTAALSITRDGPVYVNGVDPWFGNPIVQDEVVSDKKSGAGTRHRLIDGLYATAVRNAVPASIVGEAIAYLAPMTDLQRAIKDDERFTLVFTDAPRDEKRGGGRVLFAGVRRGNDWSVRCYVMKAPGNRGFACVSEGGQVSLSGAMLVPVKGVLTSKFGMRFHPIKKTERLHAGVDWAAPTGTPIRAAFSGKVTYRAVRGGYGNFIELTHKDGITSRYAHMHEFADGIELGSVVQAGDLIGYVGTTGLSTGPHLHFEIRMRGDPTDPLAFEMEAGTDEPQSVASNDIKDYRTSITDILTIQ